MPRAVRVVGVADGAQGTLTLKNVYKHELKRTAANMVVGRFGDAGKREQQVLTTEMDQAHGCRMRCYLCPVYGRGVDVPQTGKTALDVACSMSVSIRVYHVAM